MNLIITSGCGRHFGQLKNFVSSLRSNGQYDEEIVVCDNAMEGSWDAPGTWSKECSFSEQERNFFRENYVTVNLFHDLLKENEVDQNIVKAIKSPTQRYPQKFVYNTLISKKYLGRAQSVLYFDSDIYFQQPVAPIFQAISEGSIAIVKEWKKMHENPYLNKWIRFSDFSKVSTEQNFLNSMLNAENYCSGFYGADVQTFHRFNLLALLLTSNQFVHFFSDQPLVNILKSYFNFPFTELNWKYCLHLGELSATDYSISAEGISYNGVEPIAVHFNSGKYEQLERLLAGMPQIQSTPPGILARLKRAVKQSVGR